MKTKQIKKAVAAAFPCTIPVLTGYLFMGIAFGILLQSQGFGAIWAFLMALLVYAGSGQFVAAGFMGAGFNPVVALALTLMVNARHIFYGISMLDKFKNFGKVKWYMVFSLTDETFSLLVSAKHQPEVPRKHFWVAIAALNQFYWVAGCLLGGLLGQALPINTKGIEFVMTALFVVILLEQWKSKANRVPALLGLSASAVCRVLFGPQWFILAAMAVLIVVFALARKPIERSVKPE
ncbi:MAG: AzlC family ABC transporter permease [Oscillospiraceae bacterium]